MASKKQNKRRRGNRQKENRHERRQKQHSGGGEWDCIRLPEGVEVFRPEKGETYHIDVIPYIVGKHNQAADEGDEYFELSYPVYRGLGIDDKKFVAIKELCNVRDPVAEHFANLRAQDADWDDMKMFKPTQRQIMLFFVHEQADKGLQFFEGAYGTFGELLDEEIKANEEDYIDNFDDPDGGATLAVRFKAKNIGQTNAWILASKINFDEREEGFDADGDKKLATEILEKAADICLDDCLKVPTYDQLKAALEGQPESSGDEDPPEEDDDEDPPEDDDEEILTEQEDEHPEPPKKKKGKKKKPPTAESLGIEKGDQVEHPEHGTCKVVRISKDGTTVSIMDAEADVHKNINPADLEPVEQEEEPEPKKTKKKKGKAKKEPEPEKEKGEDNDWDEDWD